jgi:hypothetical protein
LPGVLVFFSSALAHTSIVPHNSGRQGIYADLFALFETNCLRPLSPPSVTFGTEYDPEEDDPLLEPGWPHISVRVFLPNSG